MMPGFDPEHLDATVVDLERAASHHDEPRWLDGLIAKHGAPLIAREVTAAFTETRYSWPHKELSVGVGSTWDTHYAIASRGTRSEMLLDSAPLTDADISGVVALAGLCDAPDRGTS